MLQTEVTRLLNEREQYEGTMKKAFMRGVCALNLEALNIFQENDNGPESSGVILPIWAQQITRVGSGCTFVFITY